MKDDMRRDLLGTVELEEPFTYKNIEHPSKKIIGEQSKELIGKCIVLGVTSSVSLYRSVDVARTLMKNGLEVHVVMSEEATRLVSPELFQWATGNPVYYGRFGGEVGHISLSEACNAMLIAPATENTVSKLAYGIADSPVTLVALSFMGAGKPVIVVPTMHIQLMKSPQFLESSEKLKKLGVIFHDPIIEGDKAKFPEGWELSWHVEALLSRGEDLKGMKILVTSGPTREYLDPVRYISNPSSGKMGLSIAIEAMYRGANVSLIHGPIISDELRAIRNRIAVETTNELLNSVLSEMGAFSPDAIIMAAAPADFRPTYSEERKISSNSVLNLALEPTPKVIEEISRRKKGSILVAFAAETVDSDEELKRAAEAKLRKYDADMIVANNVSRKDIGFSSDYNETIIVKRDGSVLKIEKTLKRFVARKILDIVRDMRVGKRNEGMR
ncbi:MAG: bifunctional phosphopantothenoylcysteine decarboxylase/phosphopantothenate--cysteine ligase CoaBC [Fervidicoccaceae archaeon]